MGASESRPANLKPTKSKSNLSQKSVPLEDISDFVSELSALASLEPVTNYSTYEFVLFNKLPFKEHFSPIPFCSRISKRGEPVFVCHECSIDEHAYLCESCFEKGNHDTHRFSIYPNCDGWEGLYCRCGDTNFMKAKKLCEEHVEAPKLSTESIDKKDLGRFEVYFNQILRILFNLKKKGKEHVLKTSFYNYVNKITTDNIYFSKILCEFLLAKNVDDPQSTNLKLFVESFFSKGEAPLLYRNLSFAAEYKLPFLREIILGINDEFKHVSKEQCEFIINFAGKVEWIIKLAKEENILFGFNNKHPERIVNFGQFYQILIDTKADLKEIWKVIVKNNLTVHFSNNDKIIEEIVKTCDEKEILSILEQFLEKMDQKNVHRCLMIVAPEFFQPSLPKKNKANTKNPITALELPFEKFYEKLFLSLDTYSKSETSPNIFLLILPYFSFGQSFINKLWDEVHKRVEIVLKNKERRVLQEASENLISLLFKLLNMFYSWDHEVLASANSFKLENYLKDTKLVEKVLVEIIDTQDKFEMTSFLQRIDTIVQNKRNLAAGVIKKNLKLIKKKGKYYNISKRLTNNVVRFGDLVIGSPLKFSEWQEFVSKKFFTDSFFQMIPNFIDITRKTRNENIEESKQVASIAVASIIINRNHKEAIKNAVRDLIRSIPDARDDTYNELATIIERIELDENEEMGKKGTKKPKLDLIGEIRQRKFQEQKEKLLRKRERMIKRVLETGDSSDEEEDVDNSDICHLCKLKEEPKKRFVYPCNFTRNSAVSVFLKSEVTDLDINICTHKIHEECYEKEKNKRKTECEICKFQMNCCLPSRPLDDDSYSKNWLRAFESIVTTINMESGKSFNSDWSTIFLTYLVYSRSFKCLLKGTDVQEKKRRLTDDLILVHYKTQLEKWPDLTKQAMKKAEKTVKGQITRESVIKKVAKTLVLDLVLQEIRNEELKNAHVKRIEKKFRELINTVGSENAEKINECFPWSRNNASIRELFTNNIAEEVEELFKIREIPEKPSEYLKTTSIKCPECNRYTEKAWECLICSKVSCENCIRVWSHKEIDHRGIGVFIQHHDARYELYYDNRNAGQGFLYRNEFEEGWNREKELDGWKLRTEEIHDFLNDIFHSNKPKALAQPQNNRWNVNDSDEEDESKEWEQEEQGGGNDGNDVDNYASEHEDEDEEEDEESE